MDTLSRSQRLLIVAGALVLAVVFAALIVYFTGFAPEHPHIKHDLVFGVLTLGSLLIAWFAYPGASTEPTA